MQVLWQEEWISVSRMFLRKEIQGLPERRQDVNPEGTVHGG